MTISAMAVHFDDQFTTTRSASCPGQAARSGLHLLQQPRGGISMRVKHALRHNALALTLLALASPALAQTYYPTRPIRIVVPLPPGSNGDLMPRILGQHLSTKLGQPVVIENRSGAAQNLGAEYVSRAEPDGYTCSPRRRGRSSSARASIRTCRSIRRSSCRSPSWRSCPTSWWCIPRCRSRRLRSSSPTPRPIPASSNYGTPGLGSSSHLTGEMLKLASRHRDDARALRGARAGASPICSPATPT